SSGASFSATFSTGSASSALQSCDISRDDRPQSYNSFCGRKLAGKYVRVCVQQCVCPTVCVCVQHKLCVQQCVCPTVCVCVSNIGCVCVCVHMLESYSVSGFSSGYEKNLLSISVSPAPSFFHLFLSLSLSRSLSLSLSLLLYFPP